ncbi:hypothetical protein LMG29739_06273 [Paraburkholderia solisilvae]|uniref:Uncharacterized protein n=1 Tax=Paraburkholderia solisilvae TaxID=624376 RepID=A0A6J5F496_9BURK|nr:hypothetical protein LMG29739_06273 [Paraburkholderia solisilvae]
MPTSSPVFSLPASATLSSLASAVAALASLPAFAAVFARACACAAAAAAAALAADASALFDACASCDFDVVSPVLSSPDLPACCVLSPVDGAVEDFVDDASCDESGCAGGDDACVLSPGCTVPPGVAVLALFASLSACAPGALSVGAGCCAAGAGAAAVLAALVCALMLCCSVCAKSAALPAFDAWVAAAPCAASSESIIEILDMMFPVGQSLGSRYSNLIQKTRPRDTRHALPVRILNIRAPNSSESRCSRRVAFSASAASPRACNTS